MKSVRTTALAKDSQYNDIRSLKITTIVHWIRANSINLFDNIIYINKSIFASVYIHISLHHFLLQHKCDFMCQKHTDIPVCLHLCWFQYAYFIFMSVPDIVLRHTHSQLPGGVCFSFKWATRHMCGH